MSNKVNPLNSLAKPKHNVREAITTLPELGKEVSSFGPDITELPKTMEEHISRDVYTLRKELFEVWQLAYQAALMETVKRGMATFNQNKDMRYRMLSDCKSFADLCLENYIESRKATISYINDCTDSFFKGE